MKFSIRQIVKVTFLPALAFGLLFLGGFQSQTRILDKPPERVEKGLDSLVVHVDLVNVLFTASDRKGKLVTDIERQNLKIYEDNRLQTITNFARETNLPLSIAVLVDTSTSIKGRFEFEQEAAIEFLHKTLRPQRDKALLITFDSSIELVQDYTDDPEILAKAIRQISPGGGTKMFDAVYLTCLEKLKAETGRKILILISDGDDNLSLKSLTETLEMAQKSDVSIYAISTNSSELSGITAHKADNALKRLAEDTGGQAFFPIKVQDLSESFQNINAELRSQYSVAYRSSNPARDGSFRSIRIESNRRNLKVKARKGYYAAQG